MFCTQCGTELREADNYCSGCGAVINRVPRADGFAAAPPKRLMRSRTNRKLAGVCGGVAEYFGVDATLVRLLWLVIVIFPPPGGLLAYIIGWIVMPNEPEPTVVYAQPAAAPGPQSA